MNELYIQGASINEQSMKKEADTSVTVTENAFENKENKGSELMIKAEMQSKTDVALLEMVEQAKGHTKDFQEYFHCDFSYTFLTDELKRRGYDNGWHKLKTDDEPSIETRKNIIYMTRPTGKQKRQAVSLDDKTAEAWSAFIADFPYKSVVTAAALNRFMDDFNNGLIDFRFRKTSGIE